MVKMIVLDLDGTLLADDKNISVHNLSVLEKCRREGIKIVIATARSVRAAERTIALVRPDVMILNGGALVINDSGETVYKKLIPAGISDAIIEACLSNKNTGDITVETETNYYVSYRDPADHPNYIYGEYYDFRKPLAQDSYKITVEIFKDRTAIEIESKFSGCGMIRYSGEYWYRFAHKEAEKMAAVTVISELEKITIDEIAAFGDDYNDIEMIRKCGTGIAMENGIAEIKQAAKYVCGNNNEDGIGKWIEVNIL